MDYTAFHQAGQFVYNGGMNKKSLTLITGNPSKAEQIERYLQQKIDHVSLDLTEIQEPDPAIVTRHKVLEAYKIVKKPVLVDDNALILTALGKLPGTFIKFFVDELGFEKICRLIDPFNDRRAIAIITIGYTDGKVVKLFQGTMKGTLAQHPTGKRGFGWDLIFIPDGYSKTCAELTQKEYDSLSPRNKALKKLEKYLNQS